MATQVTLNSGSVDSAGSLALKTNGTTTAVTINASQGVEFNAGAVGTPSITTTGDTNTGIFFPAADTIAFSEGGVESMRIDSSGNVGIGTSSPANKLDVQGVVSALYSFESTGALQANSANKIAMSLESASVGRIAVFGTDSSTFGTTVFSRAKSTGGTTESMRITSTGDLLVGTTSTSLTSGSGHKLIYDPTSPYTGQVITATTNSYTTHHLYSTGAAAYRFYVGGAGTVYATTTTISSLSDARLKENIRDLDDGLEKVMALKPRKFDWKEGKGADTKDARGFIAQEFETVFPDMIDEWKDPAPEGEEPYKSVNANLIPTLVKAIQEQQAIIQTLTDRITALEAK